MKKREKEIQNELKNLINNDDLQVPASLGENRIESLVRSAQQVKKKNNVFKIITSVAAAAAVIAVSVTMGIKYLNAAPKQEAAPESVYNESYGSAPIKDATGYKEIEDYFLSIKKQYDKEALKNRVGSIFSFGQKNSSAESAPDYVVNNSNSSPQAGSGADNNTSSLAGKADGYGKTNIQVDGIDEADIIKNDGEYLYAVSQSAAKIFIVKALPANKMQITAQIDFEENYVVDEIYLRDNQLIAVGGYFDSSSKHTGDTVNGAAESYCIDASYSKTSVTIYDITDRANPKLQNKTELDGRLLTSRLIDNKIILASVYDVAIYDDTDTLRKKCIPSYYVNGESSFVSIENIKILNNEENQKNYLTIGIISLEDINAKPQVTAVLGGGENAYCDSQNMYFAKTVYSKGEEITSADGNSVSYTPGKPTTGIFMFDISGDLAQYKAYGEVDGTIDDQFSMDKSGKYFRIATTVPSDGSNITVLDEKLQKVGEITGLSKGERIYAVRFIGDTAYVITFRQTDPLLIIDLSDPKNPTLKGELKIPGFSDYLHPYSENLLIGIGFDGTENGTNGSLKVSLFDISDSQNPREISKAIFRGTSVNSQATSNHKAFLWIDGTKEFAIPITKYDYNGGMISYLSVMRVNENNKLEITGSYGENALPLNSEILRGTYIGNTIYTISNNEINAYNKTDEAKISGVTLQESNARSGKGITNAQDDTVY